NPITTVRFSLAEAGPVRLRVYDVLGRRVAVLADSDMVAGAHSVKFEAAHLPSGMYLLRMETARQHWTHWVSLVK
ncbi:MAG: T9SS type A sorting domain-containing protein, partial [Bacteroidetes bacterium]|nr:T9SS type A sorting domain-containing protein [Bacteroidota bacterium]MCY4673518.1 T9SS type A sorting domain-containing protein [Bacteroidota bacterium]